VQKVRISELGDAVRAFLGRAVEGQIIVVEDEGGRAAYSVVPVLQPSPKQQQEAWQDILQLQQQVGRSMAARGATEEDIDRILQEQ
jgi:hypothetical protein